MIQSAPRTLGTDCEADICFAVLRLVTNWSFVGFSTWNNDRAHLQKGFRLRRVTFKRIDFDAR